MDIIYRPLDQETIDNPHSIYDRLRIEAPIFWHDQTKSWVLSRYQDCRFVLGNHELFARDQRRVGRQLPSNQVNMQIQDPPYLSELRIRLSDAFKRQDVQGLIMAARSRLEASLQRRPAQIPFDFMSDVAADVALNLSLGLIGAAGDPPTNYHGIFEGMARQMDSSIDPSRRRDGVVAASELRSLMHAWFAVPSNEGIIGAIKDGVPNRESSSDYIVNTMCGVFNACYTTLYAMTGSVFHVMLENRHLIGPFGSGISTDAAAEEVIRYISPAQGSSRYAVAPIEIENTSIKRGDAIIVLFAAANWDPSIFTAPAKLAFERSPNPHLGFGWGTHFCIGASFASRWVREMLIFLQLNHETLGLAGIASYMNMATLRCLSTLPLVVNR